MFQSLTGFAACDRASTPWFSLNPLPLKFDGLLAHVAWFQHAPPCWRKITRLSDAGLALTSMPAMDPSRHLASGNGTHTHSSGLFGIGSVGPPDVSKKPASPTLLAPPQAQPGGGAPGGDETPGGPTKDWTHVHWAAP